MHKRLTPSLASPLLQIIREGLHLGDQDTDFSVPFHSLACEQAVLIAAIVPVLWGTTPASFQTDKLN